MKKQYDARCLDVKAFAQAGAELSGQEPLASHERLNQELGGSSSDGVQVAWSAQGELRTSTGGESQVWVHLKAQACLPLTCQRCLTPVLVDVTVDRPFRFVADEVTAAELDDESEEDVLVLNREFDLHALIEDELLMALPLVPRHDVCPTDVKWQATDAAFEQAPGAKTNPFAALAGLRAGKSK